MKVTPVKGTNDYLPKEVEIRDYLQQKILEVYLANGFEHIITPVIEDIENYMKIPKKTKTKRNEIEWDFYYWLPYESGPIGDSGVPSDNGPGACGTVSGPSEIAVGIAQWTVYGLSLIHI